MEHVSIDCTCEGKICTQCKEVLCIGNYTKDKRLRSGLRADCRVCASAKNKAWREKNREYDLARHKTYRAANLDSERAKDREYKRQHADLLRERSRRWREMHLDYCREKSKQQYWKDPERSKRQSTQWRKDHPERARELDRRYRAKHAKARAIKAAAERVRTPRTKMSLEEKQAKWREYYHKNPKYHSQRAMKYFHDRPGYRASIEANRRARKKSISGTHTLEQIHDLLKRQRYRCYYCKNKFKRINGDYSFEIEHTFPVKRIAGTAIPANDISYIVLACKPCNASKGSRFPWEYPEGGRLL